MRHHAAVERSSCQASGSLQFRLTCERVNRSAESAPRGSARSRSALASSAARRQTGDPGPPRPSAMPSVRSAFQCHSGFREADRGRRRGGVDDARRALHAIAGLDSVKLEPAYNLLIAGAHVSARVTAPQAALMFSELGENTCSRCSRNAARRSQSTRQIQVTSARALERCHKGDQRRRFTAVGVLMRTCASLPCPQSA